MGDVEMEYADHDHDVSTDYYDNQFRLKPRASELVFAASKGLIDKVNILIGSGFGVAGEVGQAALFHASENGHAAVVESLLEAGVPVDCYHYDPSPLINAARGGHIRVMELLLAAGIDIEAAEDDGLWNPLVCAIKGFHVEAVAFLLEAGASVGAPRGTFFSMTPLMAAAQGGNAEIIKLLLAAGADVLEVGDEDDVTALSHAAGGGHVEAVKILLVAGSPIVASGDNTKFNCTPLTYGATDGNATVINLLLEAGCDVGWADKRGETALSKAARGGHIEAVAILIKAGAPVDFIGVVSDDFCSRSYSHVAVTPLMEAARNGHVVIVELLLEAGANISLTDEHSYTALYHAAMYGHAEIVKVLLAAGAQIGSRRSDLGLTETPLMMAARGGNATVINIFLAADSDALLVEGEDGQTALSVALGKGHVEAVKILLAAGAQIGVGNTQFGSALIKAAGSNQVKMVEFLLATGAEVAATDERGETALFKAAKWNYVEVLRVLIKAGATLEAELNGGYTLLCNAVKSEYVESVHELLAAGAKQDGGTFIYKQQIDGSWLQTERQKTPLMIAAEENYYRHADCDKRANIVRALIKGGGNVNTVGENGWTALMKAVKRGDIEVVRLLLDAGADPFAQLDREHNNNGPSALVQNALDVAKDDAEICVLLRSEMERRVAAALSVIPQEVPMHLMKEIISLAFWRNVS